MKISTIFDFKIKYRLHILYYITKKRILQFKMQINNINLLNINNLINDNLFKVSEFQKKLID